MKSMNRSWDRIVGFVTTFVVGVGAVSLIIKRVRRLLPDTYQERHHNVETDGKQTEHRGSCHCQTVSFTVIAPKSLKAFDCLAKIRYPHIVVSPSDLVVNNHDRLAQLVEHRRGATTTCFFCSKCGLSKLLNFYFEAKLSLRIWIFSLSYWYLLSFSLFTY